MRTEIIIKSDHLFIMATNSNVFNHVNSFNNKYVIMMNVIDDFKV